MAELAAYYGTFRASADTLEVRLGAYFEGDEVREWWHAVSDLLTVRYHDTMGTLDSAVIGANELSTTKRHSGLTAQELRNSSIVVRAYKSALNEAIEAAKRTKRDEGARKRRRFWVARFPAESSDSSRASGVRTENAD
jgi:hypothetical protein